MVYAFTFGPAYNLADSIVLLEAETYEEAVAEFGRRRAKVVGGLPHPQFRWLSCVPYTGSIAEALDAQGYRVVDINTPITFSDRLLNKTEARGPAPA